MNYDDSVKEDAIAYKMQGLNTKDIQKLTGVELRRLRQWFQEAGIATAQGRPSKAQYEMYKLAREIVASGVGFSEDWYPQTEEEKEVCDDYRRGACASIVAQLHPSIDKARIFQLTERVKIEMDEMAASKPVDQYEQQLLERMRRNKERRRALDGPVKVYKLEK